MESSEQTIATYKLLNQDICHSLGCMILMPLPISWNNLQPQASTHGHYLSEVKDP